MFSSILEVHPWLSASEKHICLRNWILEKSKEKSKFLWIRVRCIAASEVLKIWAAMAMEMVFPMGSYCGDGRVTLSAILDHGFAQTVLPRTNQPKKAEH